MTPTPVSPTAKDSSPTSLNPRGGPQSAAGKAQSRLNALKHGLTATTLLPAILGPEILQNHLIGLRSEWRPQAPTEELLIAEMARHAAKLELIERAEAALLRSGASAMSQMQPDIDQDSLIAVDDFLLAAAVNTEAIDRVTRYRRAHEKALHQALQRLREIRLEPTDVPPKLSIDPPFAFTEASCRDYLERRMKNPEHGCPHCGHSTGYWLAARTLWECAACGRQSGLRTGTIMENSRLPVAKWFTAIWLLLTNVSASIDELTAATKTRSNTVRRVAEKIRAARASPNATDLLAGLNLHFGAPPRPLK